MEKITVVETEPGLCDEIAQHLKALDRLSEMSRKQKHLIENGDFNELFTTNSQKSDLIKIVKDQGGKFSQLKELLDKAAKGKQSPQITALISKLSNAMQNVMTGENDTIQSIKKTQGYYQKKINSNFENKTPGVELPE